MLERLWRKGNLLALLVEMQIGTATMENSMVVRLKSKNRSTVFPSSPATGHIPRENLISKGCIHHNVHCSTVYNRHGSNPKCPSTEEWVTKMWYTYTHGILLSQKKEWNRVICRDVDGCRDCHTEWRKSGENKEGILMHVCGIEKNDTDECICRAGIEMQT